MPEDRPQELNAYTGKQLKVNHKGIETAGIKIKPPTQRLLEIVMQSFSLTCVTSPKSAKERGSKTEFLALERGNLFNQEDARRST